LRPPHAPRQQVQLRAARIDAHLHVRELVADHLVPDQRLAEGVPLPRIGQGFLVADAANDRACAANMIRSLLKLSMIAMKPAFAVPAWPGSFNEPVRL
jgi:hypothetical protein